MPTSCAAVYPERDYFKLDRAMRELELKYGWQHDNGPYAVFERDGQVVVDWASKEPGAKGKRPTPAARHGTTCRSREPVQLRPRRAAQGAALCVEKRQAHMAATPQPSREVRSRAAREDAVCAIDDLNSGDTTPIKASDMHEALGRARLVKRLGEFEPSASTTDAVLSYGGGLPFPTTATP